MNNIGVICHDAGGAEVLSHFIKYKNLHILQCLKGPAINIFKRVCGWKINYDVDHLIDNCETILFGTSWQSNLEKGAILKAKKNNIKVVVMLDHWVDYKPRLYYKNNFLLPDEIWVTDTYAKNIAKKEFKGIVIKKKENYYLKEMVNKINKTEIEQTNKNKILFIGENTSEYLLERYNDINKWGYNEITSLNFLLENINQLKLEEPTLVIRPHPSENVNKYLFLINKFDYLNIKISNQSELSEDIKQSKIVVGAESMALVVALYAGKRVISSIPTKKREISLPFKEIEKLIELI